MSFPAKSVPQLLPCVSVLSEAGDWASSQEILWSLAKGPLGGTNLQVLWLPESRVQATGERHRCSGWHLRGRREPDAVHCLF